MFSLLWNSQYLGPCYFVKVNIRIMKGISIIIIVYGIFLVPLKTRVPVVGNHCADKETENQKG